MSETAYEGDAESVAANGTASVEPETTDSQVQTDAQAESDYYADRLRELEGPPPSEDYKTGVLDAARELGIELSEPGDPGYVGYAQQETQRLREENAQILRAIDAAVQAGGPEAMQQAIELLQNLEVRREQAVWEAQAEADERAAYEEQGVEDFLSMVSETSQLIGAEEGMVDPERALEIAANAYLELQEKYGTEVANRHADELVQKTVEHISNENEQNLGELFGKAESMSHALGSRAEPSEIVDLASSVYQRELYHAGGDTTEAARSALMQATKAAAGFSDKSQPLKMSVAQLHSALDKAIPREQVKPEYKVQLERDAYGRWVSKKGSVTKQYAVEPKSPEQIRKEAQSAAIRRAFSVLGDNGASGAARQ